MSSVGGLMYVLCGRGRWSGGSREAAVWISMDGASGMRLILSRIARSILIAASMVLRWVSQCVRCAILRFERGSAIFFHLRVMSSEMSVCIFTMLVTIFGINFFVSAFSAASARVHLGSTPMIRRSSVSHSCPVGVFLLISLLTAVDAVVIALPHGHHWLMGVVRRSSYGMRGMFVLISVMF